MSGLAIPKAPKSRSPWVRAFLWLESVKTANSGDPGFKFLHAMAGRRAEKRRKVRIAPKIPSIRFPKGQDPKERKKVLRAECEALCKAVVKKRDLAWFIDDHQKGYCVSCGSGPSHTLQWGHFISQKSSKWLQYDTRNTAMQCGKCNGPGQGNYNGYREALAKRDPALPDRLEYEAKQMRLFKQDTYALGGVKRGLMRECEALGIDPEEVLKRI